MKCSICTDDLFKRVKQEVGRDEVARAVAMENQLPTVPDAVVYGMRGNGFCLHHYVQINSW